MTKEQEPCAIDLLKWLNMLLRCCDDMITLLNAAKHGGRLQLSPSDYLWSLWRTFGAWGPLLEINFTFCWGSTHPISLNHGLQVYLQLARWWPPSASQNLFGLGLQVYLKTHWITDCKFGQWSPPKCRHKLAQLWPPSLHDHGLELHMSTLARP